MIIGIRGIAATLAAVAIIAIGCSAPAASPPPGSASAPAELPADFPLGSWTTTITEEDLRAAGLTDIGALSENAGTFTMTLGEDGTWTTTQESDARIRWPVFRGTYEVTGPATFQQRTDFPPDFAGDLVDFEWTSRTAISSSRC